MKPRQCPYCDGNMERGRFIGGVGKFFLPDTVKLSPLTTRWNLEKKGCIPLPVSIAGESPVIAYACRKCKTIMIPYGEI